MAGPSGAAGTRCVATDSCSPCVEQVLRPSQQITQAMGFGDSDGFPERCHREVASPFVVEIRIGAMPRLFDQAFLKQSPNTSVQIRREYLPWPTRISLELLHQGVSVAFTTPEDDQDPERFGMKRQETFGFDTRHRLRRFEELVSR